MTDAYSRLEDLANQRRRPMTSDNVTPSHRAGRYAVTRRDAVTGAQGQGFLAVRLAETSLHLTETLLRRAVTSLDSADWSMAIIT